LDQIADHQPFGSAEQVRRDERADRRNQHQNAPSDDARQRERKDDAPERVPVVRPQIVRRFHQPEIEPLNRGIDRQHHKGQEAIYQTDEHGELGVEQGQRRFDQPQTEQQIIDRPVSTEQDAPGIGADKEVGPERQDDQKQGDLLRAPALAGADKKRQRVANQQADDRRHQRDTHRVDDDRKEDIEDAIVMFQRQRKDDRTARPARHEADEKDDRQRQQEEQYQPQHSRKGQ